MKPSEAIQILSNVTSQVSLSLKDHQIVLQALQVLRGATEPVVGTNEVAPEVVEEKKPE